MTEGKKCTDCGETIVEQTTIPATGVHTFKNGICVNCKCEKYSEGLEYTSNGDGTCYVSGIGTCTDTDVIIPAVSPNGDKVTSIGRLSCNDNLISVVIPEGVTRIEDWAFDYNWFLESVLIPDSVTTIGEYAFAHCFYLTNITISDNVTSIGQGAFLGCGIRLTSITVGENNPYYYVDGNCLIERSTKALLKGCNSSTIPQYVTSICDGAFYFCQELTTVTLPDTVTSIGSQAFQECSKLVSVTIPDSVTTIGLQAFLGCESLTSVAIGKGIASIDRGAFSSCDPLTYVYYGGTETEWCEIEMDDYTKGDLILFLYYYSETQPTTEGNFWHYVDGVPTVWEVEIHTHSYTSTVTPPTATENGVITYTCSCTDSYTEELIPQDFTVTAQNRAMVGYTGAENENLVIPAVFEDNGTWYRVTAIGDWVFGDLAFANRSNLISVTIPDSVTTIGYGAFSDCNGISSVTIPKSVVSIGRGAFADCDTLTNIVVDGYNTTYQSINGNVYSEDGTVLVAYAVGKPETSFAIPDSVIIIGEGAFSGCYNLTNVTIPNSVTTIGIEAFYRCFSLISIIIPDSVTDINTWAFYGCGLQSVTIGAGVKNVGTASFFACSSLKTIVFEDGATVIGSWMFGDCSSLTDVVIPSSISLIYGDAFDRCSVLKSIYYKGTVEEWNAIVVDNTYTGSNNIRDLTIYYYSETQPTTEGNFWHYVDGAPTIWDAVHVHTEEILPSVAATCTTSGLTEGKKCSTCGEILVAQTTVPAGHNFVDGKCTVCDEIDYSNFIFNLLDDGTYEIAAKDPKNLPMDVIIPGEYKGVSVTRIAENGFKSNGAIIFKSSVTFSKTIKSVGLDAFGNYCADLYVYDVNAWLNIEFENVSGMPQFQNAYAPGLHIIDDNGVEITELAIENGITSIGYLALANCRYVTSVVIPNSVTKIDDFAFYGCRSITSIYYTGSKEEWNAISIGGNNVNLTNATRYYYSETQPTTEGNYWHYVDGVPTVWEVSSGANYSVGLEYTLNEDGQSYSVTGIGTCTDTDIVIPNEYEGLPVTIIGSGTFSFYSHITSVTIGDSVTTIGDAAFSHCQNLASVIIPNSVTSIGIAALDACVNLNVTFANPNGWWCQNRYDATNVQAIAASVISDPATAGQYLKETSMSSYWYRTE